MDTATQEPRLATEELAHDLRNVFQTIQQAADLIAMDMSNAALAGIIVRSVEQGRRILASVSEAGEVLALDAPIQTAAQFMRDFTEMTGGPEIHFDIDVPASIRLRARPSALERSLINLFVNASEAVRRTGQPEVQVSVTATSGDQEILISVRDNGPGIPEKDLPFIFEPGYSRDTGGRGLGLHIVNSAVQAEGGSVKAGNAVGGGAVFTILLPRPEQNRFAPAGR